MAVVSGEGNLLAADRNGMGLLSVFKGKLDLFILLYLLNLYHVHILPIQKINLNFKLKQLKTYRWSWTGEHWQ